MKYLLILSMFTVGLVGCIERDYDPQETIEHQKNTIENLNKDIDFLLKLLTADGNKCFMLDTDDGKRVFIRAYFDHKKSSFVQTEVPTKTKDINNRSVKVWIKGNYAYLLLKSQLIKCKDIK